MTSFTSFATRGTFRRRADRILGYESGPLRDFLYASKMSPSASNFIVNDFLIMEGLTFFAGNLGRGMRKIRQRMASMLRTFSGTLVMFGINRAGARKWRADGVTE